MRLFVCVLFVILCGLHACKFGDGGNRLVAKGNSDNPEDLLVYEQDGHTAQIDSFIEKLHREQQFNGNVLIARKGKIIYEKAIGWADYLHRDSLKLNSVFQLASVSKPFTATAILMLVEQRKLTLDQDIKEFFPDFPYEGITIRQLLSHRSGMMNYVYFTDDIWKEKMKPMSNMEVMNLIADHKPAPYADPNQVFHYNNSNYMVLGSIIEKVTGKTYAEFMEKSIFKPCGMKNTHVYSTTVYDSIPVDVVGHDRTWRRSVRQNFLDGPVGDKGIYSTVEDLFLFDRALRNGKLLSKASLDSAYAPHNPIKSGHFSYGYGWRMFVGDGQEVVYHTGWWHGFRHIFLRDLKNDITVVMLSNLTNGSLRRLDELYELLGMPVVRSSAYTRDGQFTGESLSDSADE